jgi:hypothetical protein
MSNNNNINLAEFDFNAFQADAMGQLKSGQSLTGKDGVLTPLIKKFLKQPLKEKWTRIYQIVVSRGYLIGVMVSRPRPLKVALAVLNLKLLETVKVVMNLKLSRNARLYLGYRPQ